jgi:hypothetical protein
MIAGITLSCSGCSGKGALSPREAFDKAASAYRSEDAGAILKLYSKETLAIYSDAVRTINAMNAEQRRALSANQLIPSEGSISIRDFVGFHIKAAHQNSDDPVFESLTHSIMLIDVKGDRAVIKTDNGVLLHFVREGLFWKFSPEER